MSLALQIFLQSNESKNLKVIEQKFSQSGHGNMRKLDIVHSAMERFLGPNKNNEFSYRRTCLMTVLKKKLSK